MRDSRPFVASGRSRGRETMLNIAKIALLIAVFSLSLRSAAQPYGNRENTRHTASSQISLERNCSTSADNAACEVFESEAQTDANPSVIRPSLPSSVRPVASEHVRSSPFALSTLSNGEVSPLRWKSNGTQVSEFIHRIGLPSHLTKELRTYCDEMGITDVAKSLVGQYPVANYQPRRVHVKGQSWFATLPGGDITKSNFHYIETADEAAHDNFTSALLRGGFEEVLNSVGQYFGLLDLVVYHLSFFALSYSAGDFIHYDTTNTGGKALGIFIPIMLAEGSPPELDIVGNENDNVATGLKYEPNVGVIVGDDAMHGTAGCDYKAGKDGEISGMRLMAAVSIAEVTEDNVRQIMQDCSNFGFPPRNDARHFLKRKGMHWQMSKYPVNSFRLSSLRPGEIAPIRWKHNGTPVSKFAHRIGLPPQLTAELREYSDRIGVTDYSKTLLARNEIEMGESRLFHLSGKRWLAQKPDDWNADFHWIETGDEESHDEFLSALGDGGFDQVLDSLGKYFGLEGLVCYHLQFYAVSNASQGDVHFDFSTGSGKVFNIVIPIYLPDESSTPELIIGQNEELHRGGGLKYEYGVATVLGDDVLHTTAACDYSGTNQQRIMASIYVADVNGKNAASIVYDYANAVYPPFDVDHLLQQKGRHWSRSGGKTITESALALPALSPGEISPIRWKSDGQKVSRFLHRIGLPQQLTPALREYCDRTGISDLAKTLLQTNPVARGRPRRHFIQGQRWYATTPGDISESNFHYIETGNEETHENYMSALRSGGFDEILNSVGQYFGLQGLLTYHLSFFAVSYSTRDFIHYDFTNTGGRAFGIFIPIILVDGSPPELDIVGDNNKVTTGLKYEPNVGVIVGDDAMHGTRRLKYSEGMRLMAAVSIADINKDNVYQIMQDCSNYAYPPRHNPEHFIKRQGNHWQRSKYITSSFRLPSLSPGDIAPLRWKHNGAQPVKFLHCIGLPPELTTELRAYSDRIGVTQLSQALLGRHALEMGKSRLFRLSGNNWYVQRPHNWNSNFHWIETADEACHDDYLSILSAGGFDKVLDSLGRYFGLGHLVCYHLQFDVVSEGPRGHVHYDFVRSGGKAFNILVPLYLGNESAPELIVSEDDEVIRAGALKYEYGVAAVIGEDAYHTTAPSDLKKTDEMRIMASIYVAEVDAENVEQIVDDYANHAYPPHDARHLWRRRGLHWARGGGRSIANPQLNLGPGNVASLGLKGSGEQLFDILSRTWKSHQLLPLADLRAFLQRTRNSVADVAQILQGSLAGIMKHTFSSST